MDGEPENIIPGVKSSNRASTEKREKPGTCLKHATVCEWSLWQHKQNSSQQFLLMISTLTGMSEQDTLEFKDVFNTDFNDIVAGPLSLKCCCCLKTAFEFPLASLTWKLSSVSYNPSIQIRVISVIFIVFILTRTTILFSLVIHATFWNTRLKETVES